MERNATFKKGISLMAMYKYSKVIFHPLSLFCYQELLNEVVNEHVPLGAFKMPGVIAKSYCHFTYIVNLEAILLVP